MLQPGHDNFLQGCRAERWLQQLGCLCEQDKVITSQPPPTPAAVAGILLCAGGRHSVEYAGWNTLPFALARVRADHSVHCSGASSFLETRGLELEILGLGHGVLMKSLRR